MSRRFYVAPFLLVAACNSQPAPTPAQDPSPANSTGARSPIAAPAKQFGAAFTLPGSEALALAVGRVTKEAAAPVPSGDAKGPSANTCGDAGGTRKEASGKEASSCGSVTRDESGSLVRVSGTISAVCQKAGCWMSLQDGTADARIFMKDHTFVVPKDIVGRRAEVEGMLRAKTVTAGFAKHLAEDGGKDPAKVEGPQHEFMVTATGVRLLD